MDWETLDWLVQGVAETHDMDFTPNACATDKLRAVVEEFEKAASEAVEEWCRYHYVLAPDVDPSDLVDDEGLYLILMTLRGEGVGIWDGRWDHHFKDKDPSGAIEDLGDYLEVRLGKWQSDCGTGLVEEAMYEAALETTETEFYGADCPYCGHDFPTVGHVEECKERDQDRREGEL